MKDFLNKLDNILTSVKYLNGLVKEGNKQKYIISEINYIKSLLDLYIKD
ncbi:MAG: hypothetical protein KGD63_15105 [Candidatus Lokiarchaeota archaeon]|nr:hypothetical protein [Candidatus Lokiarchaeota archaeon]